MVDAELLASDIRQCRLCENELTAGVRPVLQIHRDAKILIAGQAPGSRVHDSGIPFDDASGVRLRAWLGLSEQQFYDPKLVAIVPMGFCYPGKGKSGDLPPIRRCAETWRPAVMQALPDIVLTLVIGQYAMKWHLTEASLRKNLTDTVRNWESLPNGVFPMPHPSPRNNIWLKKNPWFETDVLPELRSRVAALI